MICTYCGKEIIDLENLKTIEYEEDKVLVCSDKCANDFREYKRTSRRNKNKFLGVTVLNSVIAVILYIFGFVYNNILDVIATLYIFETVGIATLKYPYISVNSVKNYGILRGTSNYKKRGFILLVLGFIVSIGVFFFIKELKLMR
ncbi:MAG: hypothetical protein Q4B63_05945 [Clostridium perfringens]|nr:hypothetical protein [Clostridium perfringens]